MKKYILGSHNSMTFRTPTKWWMKLLNFTAKCQSVDIYTQYWKYDVRLFDLRIRMDEEGWWKFAHGIIEYEGDCISEVLAQLNSYAKATNDKVYVRIILEMNREQKDQVWQERCFKELCEELNEMFEKSNLILFGGVRKYDWKQIYKFKNGAMDSFLDDKYSSTTSFFKKKSRFLAILDDWFPWLYAKTHNKKNKKNGTAKNCLFVDFVNIG